MHDVARLAGVSQTTVSFVLNGREEAGISEETRERILEAVRRLGYRPNAAAQALRRGTSNLIGMITDEVVTTPYAVELIKGAQDAVREAGKVLLMLNTGNELEGMEQAAEVLIEHRVDGVILATMYHRELHLPRALQGLPTVLANGFTSDQALPTGVPDEVQGGYDAVTHLIEHGHTRIAFLNNVDDIPAARLRLDGYRRALREAALPDDETLVVRAASDQAGGFDAVNRLLEAGGDDLPTAIFCFNDRMAMGAYAALNERGLHIPGDLSVVGFDNQAMLSAHLRPGLTTLQLPHYEMGRWSAEQLLTGEGTVGTRLFHCPLVQRASVASPGRSVLRGRRVKLPLQTS